MPELISLDVALQDEVMLHFARQLPLMSGQDSSLAEHVRKLPFVNTASGTRRPPEELHDPRSVLIVVQAEDCNLGFELANSGP